MALFIKALLGAFIVILISYLSKTKYYFFSGLIPLFPTFALIAQIIVYNEGWVKELKNTILFWMLSLIPYLIYLLILYFVVDKIGFYKSVFLALAWWFFVAFLLIKFF